MLALVLLLLSSTHVAVGEILCDTSSHPICSLTEQSDASAIPKDWSILELKFDQMNSINLHEFSVDLPNLQRLVLDITHLTWSEVHAALKGLKIPALTELTVTYGAERGRHKVNLKNGMFSNFPGLTKLVLHDIGIHVVDLNAFSGLNNLQLLDLSDNYISKLCKDLFAGQKHLIVLKLQNNEISEEFLNKNSFAGLTSLQELYLQGNRLINIPAYALVILTACHTINFSNNQIFSIDEYAFQGADKLANVSLAYNKLKLIPNKALNHVKIKHLDMSGNKLRPFVLKHGESLTSLDLSHTSLTGIESDFFIGGDHITILHLSDNEISNINMKTFQNLPNLQRLDLNDNKIKTVPSKAFSITSKLDYLDLSNNEMHHIDKGIFAGMGKISWLNLAGNPWDCTCELTWLFDWIFINREQITNAQKQLEIPCAAPAHLKGEMFGALQEDARMMDCLVVVTPPESRSFGARYGDRYTQSEKPDGFIEEFPEDIFWDL